MNEQYKNFETRAIRFQTERSQREHSVPLFLTSSFVFEDAEQARALFAGEIPGNIYTRFSNPNNEEFVGKMCLLEGAESGVSFASGMAAVYSCLAASLDSGDHMISSRAIFGTIHQVLTKIFPRHKIEFSYVDTTASREKWESLIKKNTKLIFLETPTNPGLDLIDLEMIGQLARKHKLLLIVDNCFATPYLQRPLDFGAHISLHSATKYIDGQGRAIGGVAVGYEKYISEIRLFARQTGPALSPFNSWLFSKSLETLALRMERHSENAMAVAESLSKEVEIEEVRYPFLQQHPQYNLAKKQMKMGGGIVSFVLKGGYDRGCKFLNSVQMCSHTANLGDTRTIVTHPTSTTHAKLTEEERNAVGILPGLIRISVGLEHIDDILTDIIGALVKSK